MERFSLRRRRSASPRARAGSGQGRGSGGRVGPLAADPGFQHRDALQVVRSRGEGVRAKNRQVRAHPGAQAAALGLGENGVGGLGGEHGQGLGQGGGLLGVGVAHGVGHPAQGRVGRHRAVGAAAYADPGVQDAAVRMQTPGAMRPEKLDHVRQPGSGDELREEGGLHGGHQSGGGHAVDLAHGRQFEMFDAVAGVGPGRHALGALHGPQHLLDGPVGLAVHGHLEALGVGRQHEIVHGLLAVEQGAIVARVVAVGLEQGGGARVQFAVGADAPAHPGQAQGPDLGQVHALVPADHGQGQPGRAVQQQL